MTWYAASVIVSVRPISPAEGPISVYENVMLVEAENAEEAANKAKSFSASEPASDDGLTIGGKPARTTVEGVRKVVTVSNPSPLDQDKDRPVDGTEITYSEFVVVGDKALRDLVAGKEIEVTYIE